MLLYTRRAPTKEPKRRSRAGCVNCKEKKKKCSEALPACDRCLDRGLKCAYNPVKPRKRRRAVSQPTGAQIQVPYLSRNPSGDARFRSRLESLQEGIRTGLTTPAQLTPALSMPTDDWEVHSAYGDNTASTWAELPSDNSISPFDSVEALSGFETHTSQVSSMESLEGLLDPALKTHVSSLSPGPEGFTSVPPSHSPSNRHQSPTSRFVPSPTSHFAPASSPTLSAPQVSPDLELVDYFHQQLAPRLVFSREYNPFLELLVPLTSHPVVLSALHAVSSAHLENDGASPRQRSLDLHSKAVQGLALSIGNESSRDEDATLAATLLLLHYEVIKGSSSVTMRSHLNGALSMIHGRATAKTATTIFLERAFKYFDVLSALASGRTPLSDEYAVPKQQGARSALIDPLFGLVGDLWPILHRLAVLVDMKRQISANSHRRDSILQMENTVEESSRSLELFLLQWRPSNPQNIQTSESNTSADIEAALSHAEAWRQAALIHLRREIYNQSKSSQSVQGLIKQVYENCLKVMMFSGPSKGLLWPLFVASLQTEDPIDMRIARNCFRQLAKCRGMNNITRAWEIVESLWQKTSKSTNGKDMLEAREEIIVD